MWTEPTAKLSIHSLRSLNKWVELGSPFSICINQAALHTGLGDVWTKSTVSYLSINTAVFSFYPRAIRIWNMIPPHITEIENPIAFQAAIMKVVKYKYFQFLNVKYKYFLKSI